MEPEEGGEIKEDIAVLANDDFAICRCKILSSTPSAVTRRIR